MHRVRGFEKVSFEQWFKDAGEWYNEDYEVCKTALENLQKPERATKGSAGYDIFSPFTFTLSVGQEIKFPSGIKSYMQNGEVLLAFPRSSLGFKYYLKFANTIPVIDQDYYNNEKNEGEIWFKLRNEGTEELHVKIGEAVGQVIFMPFLLADGDNFKGKERKGGLGSTNA